MRGRGWIIPVVLGLIVAGLVLLVPNQPSNSPDHRSDSDAPDGVSALYELSSRLGHPTSQLKGSFGLPDKPGIMFVFAPSDPYDSIQARQVAQWVRDGGTLVYADSAIDPSLASGSSASPAPRSTSAARRRRQRDAAPVDRHGIGAPVWVAGVTKLVTTSPAIVETFRVPTPAGGALSSASRSRVAAGGNRAVGVLATLGKGHAFFLGDPLVLCNGLLGKGDNGRFAADLLAFAPAGAPVRFDEFHHGAGATSASVNDWVTTPWGAALGWALVVVFIGFLLRGRAFGPPIPILSTRDRSSAEYAAAVGTLLRRARARDLTLKVVADATRRALAERTGLGRGVPADRLGSVLQQRAPALAAELNEADALSAGVSRSESQLLKAARKLHALAYPSAKSK